MKLLYSPNEWLDKKVADFDFEKHDPAKIESEMISLMYKEGGIGLSANQVGLDARVFVMKPFVNKDLAPGPFAVINPFIEKISEEMEVMPEGCLSHPGLYLRVKRPKAVVVNFLDSSAKECTITLYDMDARVFLHEYDHLVGIEFTDRVSKLKIDMARKKQEKLKRTMING